MIVAATGHRPDKLGGYEWEAPKREWVRNQIKDFLVKYQPERCISGMALGVDQDFAFCCIELAIPFTAAIPFVGQENTWPSSSQTFYEWLLERADDVVVVSPGGYAAWKMQVRNVWMVDHCDLVLAVWDGSEGGTANCYRYACEHKFTHRINPNDFRNAA